MRGAVFGRTVFPPINVELSRFLGSPEFYLKLTLRAQAGRLIHAADGVVSFMANGQFRSFKKVSDPFLLLAEGPGTLPRP